MHADSADKTMRPMKASEAAVFPSRGLRLEVTIRSLPRFFVPALAITATGPSAGYSRQSGGGTAKPSRHCHPRRMNAPNLVKHESWFHIRRQGPLRTGQ